MLNIKYRITNRRKLKYFLECDKKALKILDKRPSHLPFKHRIWKFERLLRRTEYWSNQKGIVSFLVFYLYFIRYKMFSHRVNVEIPINCIREGLVIWHLNGIIINSNSTIGKNFSISAFCVVGENKNKNPQIGNDVELMLGAKVLGASICNKVIIGASSLVIRDIVIEKSVFAGIPAKHISNNYNKKDS